MNKLLKNIWGCFVCYVILYFIFAVFGNVMWWTSEHWNPGNWHVLVRTIYLCFAFGIIFV